MNAFIDDLINLTQMQFFIKYWWLWIVAIIAVYIILDKGECLMFGKRKVKKSEEYKPVRVGTDNGNIYLRPKAGGEVRITEESQLDRLEKRIMDLEAKVGQLAGEMRFKASREFAEILQQQINESQDK